MKKDLLAVLRCPKCNNQLLLRNPRINCGEVEDGFLSCSRCTETYTVERFVPRLVERGNYSASWGTLWQRTGELLKDSITGIPFHYNALHGEYSGEDGVWQNNRSPFGFAWPTNLTGKRVLEVGPGTGNFTEHLVETGAALISVDMSNSVDVLPVELLTRKNINVIQADINIPILPPSYFGRIWMFQVLQHTPSPVDTLKSLNRLLVDGGKLSFTNYAGRYNPFYYRLTKQIDDDMMWNLISILVPKLVPVKNWFIESGMPVVSELAMKALHPIDPRNIYFSARNGLADEYIHGQVWNRTHDKDKLMKYVLVNTFDRITPKYTNNADSKTVIKWATDAKFSHIKTWGRAGVRAEATK